MRKPLILGLGILIACALTARAILEAAQKFPCPAGYTPQMLGGFWPAILFGGSFVLMLAALIAAGFIGMAQNAPPRAPQPARAKNQAMPETLQPV